MKNWVDDHGIEREVNDVFISYRRADKKRICLLVERLENENLRVFLDLYIPAGQDFTSFLRKALNNSRLGSAFYRWPYRLTSNTKQLQPRLSRWTTPDLSAFCQCQRR